MVPFINQVSILPECTLWELFLLATLQWKKLRFREMEWFFQGHPDRKWQNSDLNPRLSDEIKFLHIAYDFTSSSLMSCIPSQPRGCRGARAVCSALYPPDHIASPPGLAHCLPMRSSVCADGVASCGISLVFPIWSSTYLDPCLPSKTSGRSGFKSQLSHFPAIVAFGK